MYLVFKNGRKNGPPNPDVVKFFREKGYELFPAVNVNEEFKQTALWLARSVVDNAYADPNLPLEERKFVPAADVRELALSAPEDWGSLSMVPLRGYYLAMGGK